MAYDLTGTQKSSLRGGGGLFFDRPAGNSIFAQVLNPPTIQQRHASATRSCSRWRRGLTTEAPPTLTVYRVRQRPAVDLAVERRRRRWRCRGRRRSTSTYVGQHAYNLVENVNINARRLRRGVPAAEPGSDAGARRTPGATAVPADQMRAFRGYSSITQTRRAAGAPTTRCRSRSTAASATACRSASTTPSCSRRPAAPPPRLQHNADGTLPSAPIRRRPTSCSADIIPIRHTLQGQLRVGSARPARRGGGAEGARRYIVNDWQLSGIWTGTTGARLHRRLSATRTAAAT